MDCRITEEGNRNVAKLAGRFGFSDYAEFNGLLAHMVAARRDFVIDLSATEFIDSAALGMLLVATEEFRTAGHKLILRNPRGQVRRTLEITTMRELFTIEETSGHVAG